MFLTFCSLSHVGHLVRGHILLLRQPEEVQVYKLLSYQGSEKLLEIYFDNNAMLINLSR